MPSHRNLKRGGTMLFAGAARAARKVVSRKIGLALLLLAGLACVPAVTAQAVTCDFGAEVADAGQCRFFYYFAPEGTAPDSRVQSRLNLQPQDHARSIAVVVGNSRYSQIPGAQLPPAAVDVAKLREFLKDDQKFDEIIVLENEDADKNTIAYFLDTYALARASLYGGKARFLFAYTGHGVQEAAGLPAALVLSNARSQTDIGNLYSLSLIRTSLENLAAANFHVVALINACYGGSVFSTAFAGGNPDVSYQPGSYALTAGAADQLVYALGASGSGSIFFDTIIKGISTGAADVYPIVVIGNTVQRGGVVRLGALTTYLTTALEDLSRTPPPGGPSSFSPPWIGPVEPAARVARGGFFFLSPVIIEKIAGPGPATAELPPEVVSARPVAASVSSVQGQPDVKIFNAPDDYPIHGVDVSQFNGEVDWKRLAVALRIGPNPVFAYIKATQRAADQRFEANWSGAKNAGVERGAYHVFRFCDSVDEQFALITRTVPRADDALPIAVDAELYLQPCPGGGSTEGGRDRLFQLVDRLRSHYGKVPVVYSNQPQLSAFADVEPARYMVWLASWRRGAPGRLPDVALAGRNPWTLWQYAGDAPLREIPDKKFDLNVFFGTAEQFRRFKQGSENVGLAASNR
jgi:GH25 family lysozyme M1 (1,4-beta-N-acetylmuramidase)